MNALFRLGRREAWRHKLRSSMVLALIALPVAFAAFALALAPQWVGGSSDDWMARRLGDAQLRVESFEPEQVWTPDSPLANTDGSLREQAGAVLDSATYTAWFPRGPNGLVTGERVEQVDAADPLVADRFPVQDGRLPAAPGEVAMTAAALERTGLRVGDDVSVTVPAVDLTVVGELGIPRGDSVSEYVAEDVVDSVAVVAPGTVARPALPSEQDPFPVGWVEVGWSDVWYAGDVGYAAWNSVVSGPMLADGRVSVVSNDPAGYAGTSEMGAVAEARGWIVTGGAFVLLWTGLVAASGLAVGARRRKRELGLLGANGADPRQLRVAVVAEGVVLGVVGSTIGLVLGLLSAHVVLHEVVERLGHDRSDVRPEFDLLWVVALWCVGVGAAALAARAAASGVTTMTTSQLLRGQRAPTRPAPAWFGAGVATFALGCGVLAVGSRDPGTVAQGRLSYLVGTAGVLLVVVGIIAVVVGATRLGGRLTAAASPSVRLAGRDLARQGVRIAAATAAVAVTLTGAMAIATFHHQRSQEVTTGRELVPVSADVVELHGGADEVAALRPELSRVVDGRVRRVAVDDALVGRLRENGYRVGTMTVVPAAQGQSTVQRCFDNWSETDEELTSTGRSCDPVSVMIPDPEMTAMLPDELTTALADGRPVALLGGPLHDAEGEDLDALWLAAYRAGDTWLGHGTSAEIMVSEATAQRLGVVPGAMAELTAQVDLDGVSEQRRAELDRLAADAGFGVTVGTWNLVPNEPLPTWFWPAIGVGSVAGVSLLIVIIALALVRAESRSDDEVLLISGAAPALVRRVNAARAGLIVVAAAVPGVVGGWFVARALMRGEVGVPWWAVGVSIVVLPVVAALCGSLTARAPRHLRLA